MNAKHSIMLVCISYDIFFKELFNLVGFHSWPQSTNITVHSYIIADC